MKDPRYCNFTNFSVLGSKLDSDIHKNICRLAFDGRLIHSFQEKEYQATELPKLKIFKVKQKQGTVERLVNDYEVICKNMFKKETNIHLFSGLNVTLSTGERGVIDGPFGQSGKFKVRIKGVNYKLYPHMVDLQSPSLSPPHPKSC